MLLAVPLWGGEMRLSDRLERMSRLPGRGASMRIRTTPLALIRNSRTLCGAADQRVSRGAAPAGPALHPSGLVATVLAVCFGVTRS